MEHQSRGSLAIVAVACLVFGMASIALALPFFWHQYSVVRSWPATMAKVRSCDIVQTTVSGEKLWSARVELTFDTENTVVIATVNNYRQGTDQDSVRAAAARFQPGQMVLVRYNPHNPEDLRLDTDQPRRFYQIPIALCITGSFFVAIAIVVFVIARR